eukprot:2393278-Prymnesium_polylepis.1
MGPRRNGRRHPAQALQGSGVALAAAAASAIINGKAGSARERKTFLQQHQQGPQWVAQDVSRR